MKNFLNKINRKVYQKLAQDELNTKAAAYFDKLSDIEAYKPIEKAVDAFGIAQKAYDVALRANAGGGPAALLSKTIDSENWSQP